MLADLPNFNIFRHDRKNARGGGVLIATKKELSCSLISTPSQLESLWVMCRAPPEAIILGVCYRPPRTDPDFARELNEILSQITNKHPNAHIHLYGDFNFPSINWLNEASPTSGNTEAREFVNVCLNFNLIQKITEPTRITSESSNILDLVLTNSPESLKSIAYLREISDHKVIHTTLNFVPKTRPIFRKTIRLYDKANYERINSELQDFLPVFECSLGSRSLNDKWVMLRDKITDLTNKFIPTVSFPANKNKPWFRKSLKTLENKKKRLFRIAKRSGRASAWDRYYAAEDAYYAAIQKAKQTFYHDDLPKILINNPRQFWEVINPQQTHDITLTNDKDEVVSDAACANTFNIAFSSVFTKEADLPLPAPPAMKLPTMDPVAISVTGISSLIDKLKLSSSAGVDINSKMLKILKKSLQCIFRCYAHFHSKQEFCQTTGRRERSFQSTNQVISNLP